MIPYSEGRNGATRGDETMTTKELSKVNAAASFMADLAAAIVKASVSGLDAAQVIALLEQMKDIIESE